MLCPLRINPRVMVILRESVDRLKVRLGDRLTRVTLFDSYAKSLASLAKPISSQFTEVTMLR